MNAKEREKGSAQVVEMAFVLPMAIGVVVSLIYLTFMMFLYVHLYGVAEVAVDTIADTVMDGTGKQDGLGDIYFMLSGEYLSDNEKEEIETEFSKKLRNLCVLPGMTSDFKFDIRDDLINPEISVDLKCSCFGGEVFTVSVKRKVYFAREFADNTDLLLQVSTETGAFSIMRDKYERLKKVCYEVF